MFDNILVVCIGNICRSPIGEELLKQALPAKKITSAGLGALVDKPADPKSEQVCQAHNVSLSQHVARQITSDMIAESDLILVMEKKHIDAITKLAPGARGKTMLYGHWLNKEIPDPYKQSIEAFEHVYKLVEQSADAWIKRL
ncbi:protein tyrosine phosphatase [Vibrio sp. UCD-FRSSP16_10]|uniref:low molecular weight protein-tyrosine-phosphatase n=1 Tax=unclassified Vibrio TaxID=2614977 RepID=UPI0007FE023A|nr:MULTISPECIES: low molecular weight protein-tyrosine-phosphatase [unclassified Vibrio]OBT13680.1 protein tyrosine phosphatase [Vibrio sp. UCD-FRSSP16_30]OBT20005.1 protein tyrosine phosphatase [Vibrio sp. UCD-FRSSP16_10]